MLAAVLSLMALAPGPARQDPAPQGPASVERAFVERAFVERKLRFEGAAELTLRGVLTLPKTSPASGSPAVLLLTESDSRYADLSTALAAVLAKAGVASLRFQERTSKHYLLALGGLGPEERRQCFAWSNLLGDADRGFDVMRSCDGVDPSCLAILGHGNGAYLAVTLAQQRENVGALILAGAPATGWNEVLRSQVGRAAGAIGSEERRIALDDLDRAMRAVIEDRPLPDDLMPFTRLLFHEPYFGHLAVQLAFDPLGLARNFRGPTLILHGADDGIVPPDQATELADAFPKSSFPGLLEHVDHGLQHGLQHGVQAARKKVADQTGPLAPAFEQALGKWLAESWLDAVSSCAERSL